MTRIVYHSIHSITTYIDTVIMWIQLLLDIGKIDSTHFIVLDSNYYTKNGNKPKIKEDHLKQKRKKPSID